VTLESRLSPAEVTARLEGQKVGRKRVRPRLGGSPVGIGLPYLGLFGQWKFMAWSGGAVAIACLAGGLLSSLGRPTVRDAELARLKRSLAAMLDAVVVA